MTPIESLHYALGEMAYSIAFADGKVQPEERKRFHSIVEAELRCKNDAFNVSDIIFHILDKENTDTKTSYDWAMQQLRLNSHYLSPQLKNTFISVLEKIAKAFPPVTKNEHNLLEKFKKEIEPLKGDPVYFEKAL